MFSSRLPASLGPNSLAVAIDRMRASSTPFIDLTVTNPTTVGIAYPSRLLDGLRSPDALTYKPEPFGMPSARDAVAREFARTGRSVTSDRVVLTSSTSEAYSILFKLLCNSGDEVLIPQPSYPLFDLLSRLEDVRAVPYRLNEHARWSIDRASLERAITPATRAVLVVSPNNPTGSITTEEDAAWLGKVCASRGIAVISDEVFLDYKFERVSAAAGSSASSANSAFSACLSFYLGGLSKSAGLPQVKLGWIGVDGPDAVVAEALERLELISDTYLSVSTPVQVAAASLIEGGAEVRSAILARIRRNLTTLRQLVAGHPDVTLLEPEAGWSAVIQVPAVEPEEQLVMRLLNDRHVLVHPGYFFDFSREAYLVLSLLPEEDVFAEGVTRVLAR